MKSFLFALTQQDILPETVLLYNGGAFLSCEGSESLEDLKKLEELGVEILTCGTCLDFYGLKENWLWAGFPTCMRLWRNSAGPIRFSGRKEYL